MAAIESYADFDAWRDAQVREAARFAAEHVELRSLQQALTVKGIAGHCVLCNATRQFLCPELATGHAPSLRESLVCAACSTNARQRAVAALLFEDGSGDGQDLPDRAGQSVPSRLAPSRARPGR